MKSILIDANELKKDLLKKEGVLREEVTITNVNGLVLPRISYKIDGIEYGNEVEQELKTKGEQIKFTENKFRVSASIPNWETTYLKHILKEGLEHKEKYCIFKTTIPSEEHMNIYSSQNAIKEVEGETLFKAIKNSLDDLNEKYRERAIIVMKKRDYIDMVDKSLNSNFDFYTNQSCQLLGIKVVFCEFADKPVVGDFSQLHINYEDYILLENQRGLTDNLDNIIISGNFDIRVRLSSAFRIAKVNKGY